MDQDQSDVAANYSIGHVEGAAEIAYAGARPTASTPLLTTVQLVTLRVPVLSLFIPAPRPGSLIPPLKYPSLIVMPEKLTVPSLSR